jgi:AcrR family transcriptional regulator
MLGGDCVAILIAWREYLDEMTVQGGVSTMQPVKRVRSNKKNFVRDCSSTLFVKKGYHGTSMDDIVNATALNKGTIYFYFKSKSDIFFDILDMVATNILGRIFFDYKSMEPLDAIKQLISCIVATIFDFRDESTVYFKEMPWIGTILPADQCTILHDKEKAFYEQCRKIYQSAADAGLLQDISFHDFYHILMGVSSFTHRWLKRSSSLQVAIEQTQALVLFGVVKR